MAPQTEKCLTCLKKFTNTDLAVQLACLDTSNNVTVQNKLQTCVPEVANCSEQDELCTTCNYMLGICYKFRMTCLKSQEVLMKETTRLPLLNNSLSIHPLTSNQKSTPAPNCEPPLRTYPRANNLKTSTPKSIVVKNSDSLGIVQTVQSKSTTNKSVDESNKGYMRTPNGFMLNDASNDNVPRFRLTLQDLLDKPLTANDENHTPMSTPTTGKDYNTLLQGKTADERIEAIESDPTLSDQERSRLLVAEILKCNSHLKEFTPEQFECQVDLEPLPKFYVPKNQDDDKTGYLCQCNHCGLTFTSKVKLLSHIRRHFKYKPHKCSLCDRRYYEADDLKMHMMAHKVNDQKKQSQPPAAVSTPTPPPPPPPPPVSPVKEPLERASKTKFNSQLKDGPPVKLHKLNSIEKIPVNKPKPSPKPAKDPLELIPTINIKTESFYEELNAAPPAPSVSKAPKTVKKPPPKMPNPPTLQKRPTQPTKGDSVDFLDKYITNLRCRFCNLLFQSDAETAMHSKLHCNICFELCQTPNSHENYHSVLLNKNKKKIYLCLICGTHNPRGHFIIHNKVHDIVCEICSSTFTTDKMFQHHRQSCPEYHCKYCGKTFATLTIGRTHEYHTHEKQYRAEMRCPKCKKQFSQAKQLRTHTCKKCESCGEFVDTKLASTHFCAEQPIMEELFDPLVQSLLDPLQQTAEAYEQSADTTQEQEPEDSKANIPLLIPMPTAEGEILCEVCSKSFPNKTLFNVHECYDEKGVRIYRCEICTGYFSRLEFIDHMKVHIS